MAKIRTLDVGIDFTKPRRYANCTQAVKLADQPFGGFISPKLFKRGDFIDESTRCELVDFMSKENLHPTVIGVVVDYLTRFVMELENMVLMESKGDLLGRSVGIGQYLECLAIPSYGASRADLSDESFGEAYSWSTFSGLVSAFNIACREYIDMSECGKKNLDWTDELFEKVLSDNVIFAMCQLTAFDNLYRSGRALDDKTFDMQVGTGKHIVTYSVHSTLIPDEITTSHIRTMVKNAWSVLKSDVAEMRALNPKGYLKEYRRFHPRFHIMFPLGMPRKIAKADADFEIPGTLVDMKVSKNDSIDKQQTLQIIIYYIMQWAELLGLGTGARECPDCCFGEEPDKDRDFSLELGLQSCMILNPRQGIVWRLDVKDVDTDVLCRIVDEVMGGYEGIDTRAFIEAIKIFDVEKRKEVLSELVKERRKVLHELTERKNEECFSKYANNKE